MAYREMDEPTAQRAAARKELEELAAHGARRTVRARRNWAAGLPFEVEGPLDLILRSVVKGWLEIRVGVAGLGVDDFLLVQAAVRRVCPAYEARYEGQVVVIDGRISHDPTENNRMLHSVLVHAVSALYRLLRVEYVRISNREPAPVRRVGGWRPPLRDSSLLLAWLVPLNGIAAFSSVGLHEGDNALGDGVMIRIAGREARLTARATILLNGQPTQSHALTDNDRFTAAGIEFVYKSTELEPDQPFG